jgi:hypothetical protein
VTSSINDKVFASGGYVPFLDPTALKEVFGPILDAIRSPENERGRVIEDSFEVNKGKIELIIQHIGPIYLYVVSEEDNIFSMAWPLRAMTDLAEDSHCWYVTVRILQSTTMVHVIWMSTILTQPHNCALDPGITEEEKSVHRSLLRRFKLRSRGLPNAYQAVQRQSDDNDGQVYNGALTLDVEGLSSSGECAQGAGGALSAERPSVLPAHEITVTSGDEADNLGRPNEPAF